MLKRIFALFTFMICLVIPTSCDEQDGRPAVNDEQLLIEEEAPAEDLTPAEDVPPAQTDEITGIEGDEMDFNAVLEYLNASDFVPSEGFDRKSDDITYGELTEIEYFSETTGVMRKAYVYTPPDFDPNFTYPVLYLLHGIGGTHSEWLGGRPNEVIGNLIAAGEAPPMIAVIPNIRAMEDDSVPSDIFSAENIAAFDNFINDLRDDLMPFIKENYPVSDKREQTAIAGLSMGGRETLFIAAMMPETFAYIGAFAPAPGLMTSMHDVPAQLTAEDIAAIPEEYKNNMFLLINTGNQDGVVGENPLIYYNAFIENGIKGFYYSIDGGHDFSVWKNGLYYFVKNIF